MSSNRMILLVEDKPGDVDLTRRACRKARVSNELAVVEDGQEALDYVRREGAYSGRNLAEEPALVLLGVEAAQSVWFGGAPDPR